MNGDRHQQVQFSVVYTAAGQKAAPYFADPSGAARCADCLTEKHARAIQAEGSDDEAVFRYLERLRGQLPHHGAAAGAPQDRLAALATVPCRGNRGRRVWRGLERERSR